MNSKAAFVGAIAIASLSWTSASAATGWQKFHQSIRASASGPVIARFTTIELTGVMESEPFLTRFLIQDEAGRLLVVRYDFPDAQHDTVSIQCLPSGETVSFEVTPMDSLTVRFGDRAMVVRLGDLDVTAAEPPEELRGTARGVIRGMSPACEAAMRELARLGTTYSTMLHIPAAKVALLLHHDIQPTVPTLDTTSDPVDVVRPFDPATTAPNAFEAQFGNAYFE